MLYFCLNQYDIPYIIQKLAKQQIEKKLPMSNNLITQYEQRLNNLPEVNQQVAAEIKKYEQLVDDQNSQISIQTVKIKAMQSQLLKYDKQLEKIQNEINQLSQHEEKSMNKEKKYLMQIDNYNKKIDTTKTEVGKTQKSITLLRKQIKTIQSEIVSVKSDKIKIQQILTKEQIKINSFTQNLNDLKLKIMEQGQPGGNQARSRIDVANQVEREQKQISQLFNAIKKQMALIDVLKRQKVHLIASTVFKHCEQQFEKVLQMNKQK